MLQTLTFDIDFNFRAFWTTFYVIHTRQIQFCLFLVNEQFIVIKAVYNFLQFTIKGSTFAYFAIEFEKYEKISHS